MFFNKPIKVTQGVIENQFQTWLETIVLVDDKEAARLGDWTVGFYHCKHCGAYQGFSYKLPPVDGDEKVNPQMHNDRNEFWRAHAHGDGRVILFEKDIPVLSHPTHAIIKVYLAHEVGGRLLHETPRLQIGKQYPADTITFGVIVTLDEFNKVMTGSGV
jgi:hypothetical protein